MRKFILQAALLAALGSAVPATAQQPPSGYRFEHELFTLRLIPRPPEQIGAFYQGRGFPATMVQRLQAECFITVGMRNKSDTVVWLDLAQWRFHGPDGEIPRFERAYWRDEWARLEMPMPSRSTFRWTLLPEVLDFRPDEGEGGNIVLPRVAGEFALEARFATGEDKAGEVLTARIEGLRCAENPAP